jgi:DNA-binding transcriptional MerR regulator
MSRLTIRDLETLSGIKAHTIRVWEQRYRFLKPRRSDTNIRYYCPSELKLVLDVALLIKTGMRVSQFDQLTPVEIREKIREIPDEAIVKENRINELIGAMADLDTDRFEDIINRHTAGKGIESSVAELIYPFLERSGLLWQSGHIEAAQEQLVSHIIRQKLVVAIETTAPKQVKEKTFLLFLPEGEYHELGLLLLYYLLKSRGYHTFYLGANVPVNDLAHIVSRKKPDQLVMHLATSPKIFRAEKFLKAFGQKLPGVPLVISGRIASPPKQLPDQVEWKKDLFRELQMI